MAPLCLFALMGCPDGAIPATPASNAAVSPDMDADGDGYRSDVDDCDDARAWVFPGANDPCDALDQDCDGVAIPPGTCSALGSAHASRSWQVSPTDTYFLPALTPAPDLTGDGLDDLVLIGDFAGSSEIVVVSGDRLVPSATPENFLRFDLQSDTYIQLVGAADMDGDGLTDLAYDADSECFSVILGSPSGWPAERIAIQDVERSVIADASGLTCQGISLLADTTGDELPDAVGVLWGAEARDSFVVWRSEDQFAGASDEAAISVSLVGATTYPIYLFDAGDLDGDGLSDMVAHGSRDSHAIVVSASGADLAASDGAAPEALFGVLEPADDEEDGQDVSVDETSFPGSDVDGDGLVDVLASYRFRDNYQTRAWRTGAVVIRGLPVGDVNELAFARLYPDPASSDSSSSSYPLGWVEDTDGDAVADLLIGLGGVEGVGRGYCIFRAGVLRGGGLVDASDPRVQPYFCMDESVLTTIDLDGDGRGEWFGTVESAPLDIARGFDVPWADPGAWE
ncbi:hypothetical protein LBMAG42_56600 [Deltaproteobacteria bacterium]|nr:hypothetical protein LBMAG42_56600 [Deltaproteobacteria bacterium]